MVDVECLCHLGAPEDDASIEWLGQGEEFFLVLALLDNSQSIAPEAIVNKQGSAILETTNGGRTVGRRIISRVLHQSLVIIGV